MGWGGEGGTLRPKHRRQLRHPQRNLGMRLSHQPPPRQYRALEQTARLLQSIARGSAAAVRKAATGHTVLATSAASSAATAGCAVCAALARPAPASQLSIFLSRTLRRRLCGDGRVPKEEGQVAGDLPNEKKGKRTLSRRGGGRSGGRGDAW